MANASGQRLSSRPISPQNLSGFSSTNHPRSPSVDYHNRTASDHSDGNEEAMPLNPNYRAPSATHSNHDTAYRSPAANRSAATPEHPLPPESIPSRVPVSPQSRASSSTHQRASSSIHKQHSASKFTLWAEAVWLWEVVACILSIACFAAIIGVLIYEDGKPLEQWSLFIAPNAIVSFLATLAKSAFLISVTAVISQYKWLHFLKGPRTLSDFDLFDAASRDPVAAFFFIVRKNRQAMIGSIAAFVVLLALLVDPFVQLVFSFPSEQILVPGLPASFSHAQLYDPNCYPINLYNFASLASSVDTGLQAAIVRGLYNDPIQYAATCPSGNCTWTDVTTLGVCATITDITSKMKMQCTHNSALNTTQCTYEFPGLNTPLGAHMSQESSFGLRYPTSNTQGLYVSTTWNSTFYIPPVTTTSEADPLSPAFIQGFQAIHLPSPKSTELPDATAWQGVFSWCAKTYDSVNVTNGTTYLSTPVVEPLYMIPNILNWTDGVKEGETFTSLGPKSSPANFDNITNPKDFPFAINLNDYTSLGLYMQQLFTVSADSFGEPFAGSTSTTSQTAPNMGRTFSQSPNITNTMQILADSMSESIRLNPNATLLHGEAYVEKSIIHIQWYWLILPIFLALAAACLLAFAIVQSRRRQAVAWKDSGLALLFHNLEGFDVDDAHLRSRAELDALTEDMKARLVVSGHVRAFVNADEGKNGRQ